LLKTVTHDYSCIFAEVIIYSFVTYLHTASNRIVSTKRRDLMCVLYVNVTTSYTVWS